MTVPFTFANGTTADATQVNANFSAVLALTGGTITGPMTFNAASTFNANATFNFPVTVNAILTLGSTLSVPSITYPGTEGHNIAFGWDGTAIVAHVDGTGTPGRLAAWNSSPTFANVSVSSALSVGTNVSVSSALSVGGNVTVSSALSVGGNVTISGFTSCSTMNTNAGGITTAGLQVNGGAGITGGLNVSGVVNAGSLNTAGTLNVGTTLGVTGSANVNGNLAIGGGITAANNILGGNVLSGNDSIAAGVFRRSAVGGPRGALLECWGGDWDAMGFIMSGGILFNSPDRGASGFFFTPSGSFSDASLKDNIVNTSVDALAAITATPVRSFDWNEEGIKRLPEGAASAVPIGFVAQELQPHVPEAVLVNKVDNDLLIVDHAKLVPYLARAIQQQQEMIEQLTQRIAALEAKA